ncbi:MAG: S8/S53 family peptidase [Myxococcota bacterium]
MRTIGVSLMNVNQPRAWVAVVAAGAIACDRDVPPDPTADYDRLVIFANVAADCTPRTFDAGGYTFQFEPLFTAPSGGAFGPDHHLSRFCAVDVVGREPPDVSTAVSLLDGSLVNGGQIEADPIGLVQTSPQYGPLVELNWPFYFSRFMRQIGAIDVGTLAARAGVRPRIAIIDSANTADTPGWTSGLTAEAYLDHGLTLARLAEEMVCIDGDPEGECLADVVSVRAMSPDGDRLRGSLGQLARAIVQAVNDAPDPETLIINLSMGWVNPLMGGDRGDIYTGPETTAAGAVHEALQYARCSGAVVLAAAGNRVGAFDNRYEVGPIRPAHWWQRESVDSELCQQEFGLTGPSFSPLITAIGAIADGGQRMAIFRPESEPQYVASGMAAVAPTESGSDVSTALLSGTSVPVIVGSAAIALLHHVVFDQAQTIETTLPQWTTPTGRVVGGTNTPVLSIRLDEVLMRAGGPSAPRMFAPASLSLPSGTTSTIAGSTRTNCALSGGSTVVVRGSTLSAAQCDRLRWESIDERPATYPQPLPSGGGCPGCVLNLSSQTLTAQFSIDTTYQPAFVEIADSNFQFYYALPAGLVPGIVYEIMLEGLPGLASEDSNARILMVDNASEPSMVGVETYVF